MIKISDVNIDKLKSEDIDPIVSYWYDTPKEFWLQRGVELKFRHSRDEMGEKLKSLIDEGVTTHCVVDFKGHRIGMHTLTHIESERAIMHAHYWDPSFRGQGIGPISYVKAIEWFIDKNNFQSLIFQTPKANSAANRVKEKLGIPVLKEVVFDGPVLVQPVPAWQSEVRKEDLPDLYHRLSQLYPTGQN